VLALLGTATLARAEPTAAPREGTGAQLSAPGWEDLDYPAPAPGTYELPSLGSAADGHVLDVTGTARRLHDFLGDKVAVLSFIYTSCPDVNGCPLATHVLSGLQRRLLDDRELRDDVRLVTLSFDPAHDRPEVLARFRAGIVSPGSDWPFLTTESQEALTPILEAYGQSVQREVDADGEPLGTISHILRVFLIDREKRIRNIYTTSFLHRDTVWSDIRTVLVTDGAGGRTTDRATTLGPRRHGPGDDKRGYGEADYRTRSRALSRRHGERMNLLRLRLEPPRGLPPLPVEPTNLPTDGKIALGRKLFFDRRLSRNKTISCAMCHIPEQGFTSNEIATAIGIEGQAVRRNAPTLYNVAFAALLFHDGRERRLEQQIWGPLLAANEMGNPSVGYVLDTIAALRDYAGLFEAAFDGRPATMETLGLALASYQRTLLAADSPFDRWHFAGAPAPSLAAARGFRLFTGKARCAGCHPIGERHALFADQGLHNTGIGYRQTMRRRPTGQPIQVAPGRFLAIAPAVAAEMPPTSDLGRYEITEDPDDRWKYKTPSLRNVALTAPYMHDGSLATLHDVVAFYNAGGVAHELLDPRIRPLGLDAGEVDDLVAFLESLTGASVDAIVADAFAAPVGDPGT
jgi:cytochrome c peroxidase